MPAGAGRVRCVCDQRHRHRAKKPDAAAERRVEARSEICQTCAKFHRVRCDHIDMGCSCTYAAQLRDPAGRCPLSKWLEPVALVPIRQERLVICAACDKYQAGTCSQLEDYSQALERLGNRCPLGKWEASWQATTDAVTPRKARLVITVGVGEHCRELLAITAPAMRRYARRCGADFVQLTERTQTWWGLEKFRVQAFAQAYERTLFLDADVVVRSTAPDLFEICPVGSVALHDDAPHLRSTDWIAAERPVMLTPQGVEVHDHGRLLNSGVVMCDAATASVWQPPPQPFAPTHCAEQFWVEYSALSHDVWPLATRYNCQYWMPRFHALWPTSHLVHLANCPPALRLELAAKVLAW